MSTNTQADGRNSLTERDYVFTPQAGEDQYRALARYELEMLRNFRVGDPNFDPVFKQASLDEALVGSASRELFFNGNRIYFNGKAISYVR